MIMSLSMMKMLTLVCPPLWLAMSFSFVDVSFAGNEELKAAEQPENLDHPNPDRANLEPVTIYGDETLTLQVHSAMMRPWTKLRHVRYAQNGNELLAFDEHTSWWAGKGAFLPLYRIAGEKPMELLGYHTVPGEVLRWESYSLTPKVYVQPGELVALDPSPMQLENIYRVYKQDGTSGLADISLLKAAGDAGINK